MGQKKGGKLNANISYYLAIKDTAEAYICVDISLITVIYKRISKLLYITQSEVNSCK